MEMESCYASTSILPWWVDQMGLTLDVTSKKLTVDKTILKHHAGGIRFKNIRELFKRVSLISVGNVDAESYFF